MDRTLWPVSLFSCLSLRFIVAVEAQWYRGGAFGPHEERRELGAGGGDGPGDGLDPERRPVYCLQQAKTGRVQAPHVGTSRWVKILSSWITMRCSNPICLSREHNLWLKFVSSVCFVCKSVSTIFTWSFCLVKTNVQMNCSSVNAASPAHTRLHTGTWLALFILWCNNTTLSCSARFCGSSSGTSGAVCWLMFTFFILYTPWPL